MSYDRFALHHYRLDSAENTYLLLPVSSLSTYLRINLLIYKSLHRRIYVSLSRRYRRGYLPRRRNDHLMGIVAYTCIIQAEPTPTEGGPVVSGATLWQSVARARERKACIISNGDCKLFLSRAISPENTSLGRRSEKTSGLMYHYVPFTSELTRDPCFEIFAISRPDICLPH